MAHSCMKAGYMVQYVKHMVHLGLQAFQYLFQPVKSYSCEMLAVQSPFEMALTKHK